MKRTPLKRKTPLKRGGRLNPVSKKQASLNRKRRTFVADQLSVRQFCEAGPKIMRAGHDPKCQRLSTEIHEPILRSAGGSITSVENSVALCRLCHRWIHDNVGESEKLGLIQRSSAN